MRGISQLRESDINTAISEAHEVLDRLYYSDGFISESEWRALKDQLESACVVGKS